LELYRRVIFVFWAKVVIVMTQPQEIDVTQPVKQEFPKEKYDELESFINSLETTEGALIEILHKAQDIFGYLSRDVQLFIARKLGIPGAEVHGVVSFYSYFTTKPSGIHTISICMGTACFVRGADKIAEKFKERLGIESNETTEDGLFTIKDVRCIGACGLAPVVKVDDKVYGKVKVEDVDNIINTYRRKGEAACR
jgi:NADH-quinone oxidoreductase subunit E/NADP-reducing hydrogenase subunit HndA